MTSEHMTAPAHVSRQYAAESNLETRSSVWRPGPDGRDTAQVAFESIRDGVTTLGPRVLEVGCGTGTMAGRLLREVPGIELSAVDQSERMVELTRARGVDAQVADAQDLPFADASYDVVAALWMLYHLPDLDRGLAEIARVLEPGGLFVAVTNGDEHNAALRRDAGGDGLRTSFSRENGAASLARHFHDVRREDLESRAVFPDHAAAVAYLDTSDPDLASRLPWFDGPREYAGYPTLFTAHR